MDFLGANSKYGNGVENGEWLELLLSNPDLVGLLSICLNISQRKQESDLFGLTSKKPKFLFKAQQKLLEIVNIWIS